MSYAPSSSGSSLEAKVVILGSQGVGKTSLVVRYLDKTFSPNCTATIGASFTAKKLLVDNCKVRLQIWDTAGQGMAPMYYRGAHAAILVYDITQEQSFLDMNSWVEELKKNLTDSLVIHVVGNKSDLAATQRAVPLKRTQEYVARALGAETPVHEVSAKDDNGTIEELFLQITRTLVERKHSGGGGGKRDSNIIIPAPQPKPSNSCCW
ncbi:P-loop containing nucleoside triphosphate hydrolase protein [Endogone sp. FLAS-F59071]|nr:P-loop containing nucleoside triphosphate hydrolase protein [Endogone sp. FLAS-F59071]|eukprot:RUS22675.1 P-loop containing nucleoside triphosphate hydrolase protein [Endogone sp. FLAS-F59071]